MTSQRPVAARTAPSATYRLQLSPGFTFAAAREVVPYLAALGVSHLHLSPVLEAVPGSTHGYDVVDHARVRAEIGGEEGLRALAATAQEHGLGIVLDIVPNHMAALSRHNRALWEVLREGPHSSYARWFDIDWQAGGDTVLLPVLAHRIGRELDQGLLRVDGDVLRYHDHAFPLREGTAELPLPELLDAQWYRLAWWRLARTELNYRRFFTISDLIGVRVEDPDVFAATHDTVLRLVREGVVQGLRIDHPDGLADPGTYLRRLHEASAGCWTVVEKVLADGERLPAAWPVAGTTGYDALRHIDALFVDPRGAEELRAHYLQFTEAAPDGGGHWEATVRRAADEVVTHDLAAEVDRLTRAASRCTDASPALRDHPAWALRAALRELLVRLRVYRPYGTGEGVTAVLADAVAEQARAAFAVPEEAETVNLVLDLLIGRGAHCGPEAAELRDRFAQTSSALRAKAVEDTACYRYAPLLSAAEVGGDPGTPALPVSAFHAFCTRVQGDWPTTSTVLSTHDTKRSADVRAGLAVLTECPDRWAEFLARVGDETAFVTDGRAPDPQTAWAVWQTAVGLGRLDKSVDEDTDKEAERARRLREAMVKHAREAGLFTNWTEPDPLYEEALTAFVDAGPCGRSAQLVDAFTESLRPHVRANILGAALLHLTMPGVPDVYQGSEITFRALVDPDNRRPVRFAREHLERIERAERAERTQHLMDELEELDELDEQDALDYEKLALTRTALRLRRQLPGVFGESATYEPLEARGPGAEHCVAFLRSGPAKQPTSRSASRSEPETRVVTAASRLSLRLAEAGGWRDTWLPLPAGRYVDVLADEREFSGHARVADLFRERPVALLVQRPQQS